MRTTVIAVTLSLMTITAAAQEVVEVTAQRCDSSQVRWGGEVTHVEQETIEAASLRSLSIAARNAPVSVRGGNARGYTIEVCKAAASPADLARVRVWLDGSQLRAEGPEGRWTVFYSVAAPAGADIELETKNGPVSVRDYEGALVVRASNGPLTLTDVHGTVDGSTKNGPVTIRGGSGTMKVRASNGPLSIHLEGSAWMDGSLEASTQNGPVTVKLPRAYASGVVVESTGRGPLSCNAEGCAGARSIEMDRWHGAPEPRRIELGSGGQDVRISSVNGPITIRNE